MISSPGCVCLGEATPGSSSTRTWITSRPGTLRSCRWRSMRLKPGCWARAACSAKPMATSSSAAAVVPVALMCTSVRPSMDERSKRLTQLGCEEVRLLPRGEVSAFVDLVEVNQVGIGAPRPRLRGSIDVFRKYRNGDGELDLARLLRGCDDNAASCAVLPVEPSRRGCRVR